MPKQMLTQMYNIKLITMYVPLYCIYNIIDTIKSIVFSIYSAGKTMQVFQVAYIAMVPSGSDSLVHSNHVPRPGINVFHIFEVTDAEGNEGQPAQTELPHGNSD